VTSVRATGGVFRSVLWRRVLAATLGRPVTVTGAADGSALGAAALGLLALGRADTLPAAVELLSPEPNDRQVETPETASPAEVAFYTRLRASVPEILADYDEIGRLFAASAPARGASGAQ
jgi:gluconokinase